MVKATRKKSAGSNHHKVSYGTRRSTTSVPINQTGAQLHKAKQKELSQLAALSFVQREEIYGNGDYDIDMPNAPDYYPADGWKDLDSDEEEVLQGLPPGEEGYYHSHAGKEETFDSIVAKCQPGRGDPRKRAHCVQQTIDAWNQQMPVLVEAYLELKANGPFVSDGKAGAWTIPVIGFEEERMHSFIHTNVTLRTNETLIRHGFLGASPEKVGLAISIHALEVYRQIHRVCPRYSMGAFSKTLTNLHQPHLAEQLSTAYDAYLEIMRRVDAQLHLAMGRDAGWYIRNVCAPCLYKVQNEAPLKFSWLGCMDGNSSLKLIDATFRPGNVRPDNRASTSFRWLSPEQVDRFKDEVATAQKKSRSKKKAQNPTGSVPTPTAVPTPTQPAPSDVADSASLSPDTSRQENPPAADQIPIEDDNGDVAWLNVNELSGAEAEELDKCVDTCVERWKAAGPEARKKMFAFFAIAGIFLTVCRHGHVIIMCDMIRSGELMKYPIAMVRWLLDQYGADIGLGYDIMCAFWKTLRRSSLGADVTAMRLRGVVPAFHGHAHNRACQIGWHPLYVDGVGLEDFEECERTFSLSNHLASTTRLATAFHRQQQIDEHFQFHDQDKHAASGNFIFQNYRQALEKITFNRLQLTALERSLGTTSGDYELDHLKEIKYFESLREEPPEYQQTVDYMELLQKLFAAEAASNAAKIDFLHLDHHIINDSYTAPQIARVRTRYRTSATKYQLCEEAVGRFEEERGIEVRWTPDSREYTDALVLSTERKHRAAVTEVERLVVQRLFELTKLGMSGVAYKLREKISKALKSRSEAIRRALIIYNEAGAALNPPRERLTFADVIHNTSLAEFDLLRETRSDIRQEPWTQPARREAGVLYYGIKRAKEEIKRLNVEITRTITYLVDEHVDYYHAIAANIIVNPSLASALQKRWLYATRISTSICKRLTSTSRLAGFSGTLFPGVREGNDPARGDGVPPPSWLGAVLGVMEMEVQYDEGLLDMEPDYNDAEESELVVRELDLDDEGIVDLMEHLSTFEDV